jgi:hypothetical protein
MENSIVNGCVLDNELFQQYYSIFKDYYAQKIDLDIGLKTVALRVKLLQYFRDIDKIVEHLEPWNRGRIITFAA